MLLAGLDPAWLTPRSVDARSLLAKAGLVPDAGRSTPGAEVGSLRTKTFAIAPSVDASGVDPTLPSSGVASKLVHHGVYFHSVPDVFSSPAMTKTDFDYDLEQIDRSFTGLWR